MIMMQDENDHLLHSLLVDINSQVYISFHEVDLAKHDEGEIIAIITDGLFQCVFGRIIIAQVHEADSTVVGNFLEAQFKSSYIQ